MTIPEQAITVWTVDDFEAFITLPANSGKRFEFIGGEIVEVVSNNYSSEVAGLIFGEIYVFIRGKNMGRMTVPDGGFQIGEQRYMPDVAYISRERQPKASHETWNSTVPDLVADVLSPTDDLKKVMIKVTNYINAGSIVWLVDPQTKAVQIHASGVQVQVLTIKDDIPGGDVLPGFSLPVKMIFPE